MQVSTLHQLRPALHEAERVVIYDTYGNPILVAVQLGVSCIKCASVRDDDFAELLLLAGVKQVPVITQFQSTLASP